MGKWQLPPEDEALRLVQLALVNIADELHDVKTWMTAEEAAGYATRIMQVAGMVGDCRRRGRPAPASVPPSLTIQQS
jgi:hypothetical protein